MGMKDVTRQDVLKAIAEFDDSGRDKFLADYGMGEASKYFIRYEGGEYDSKAIMAAAHGKHPGFAPLKASEFSGGESHTVRYLRNLGFAVPSNQLPWKRDELILVCDVFHANGEKTPSKAQREELSDLLQQLPIYPPEIRGSQFRNENSVRRKIGNLLTSVPEYPKKPTKGGAGDRKVVQDFRDDPVKMHKLAEAIRAGLKSGQLQEAYEELADLDFSDDDDEGTPEGGLLRREHFYRERDRKKRQQKIDQHRKANNGKLACETCGFDFGEAYGDHGDGYIECHHIIPLSESGPTTTRLADLILICSNCHRMIHRRSPWLNPDQLRALLNDGK
jgi:5-methylcytosine-specific restriction protein A